ncbi:hypothetical protein ACHHYP_02234 [Achlya hypogyna]|uniref:AB hydrolase-1 domain-containing protein n=1 Tax=Achlya hypogyna TaxID=1202772 RepID=A0A1V9ZS80_ACHHY|nr:hypothetical protein ACHHYP_02234 [Achlya hypogyna]
MLEVAWHGLPRWLHLILLAKAASGALPPALARVVFSAIYGTLPPVHLPRPSLAPARPLLVLPPYHSTVYRPSGQPRSRIVLLHGWGMSSKDWALTARKLQKEHGHAVLTLDFFGHGFSPYLPHNDQHDPHVLVHQVHDAVRRAGWEAAPVTIAGISMGSAIALRYAQRYPDTVHRLILMCGAGMTVTRWYAWTDRLRACNNALLRKLQELNKQPTWHALFHYVPPLRAMISHSYLTRLTPEYGVDQQTLPQTLQKVHACIWPMVDPLHPLQLELFDETPEHVAIVPGVDHALFCLLIDFLQLHSKAHLWQ